MLPRKGTAAAGKRVAFWISQLMLVNQLGVSPPGRLSGQLCVGARKQ